MESFAQTFSQLLETSDNEIFVFLEKEGISSMIMEYINSFQGIKSDTCIAAALNCLTKCRNIKSEEIIQISNWIHDYCFEKIDSITNVMIPFIMNAILFSFSGNEDGLKLLFYDLASSPKHIFLAIHLMNDYITQSQNGIPSIVLPFIMDLAFGSFPVPNPDFNIIANEAQLVLTMVSATQRAKQNNVTSDIAKNIIRIITPERFFEFILNCPSPGPESLAKLISFICNVSNGCFNGIYKKMQYFSELIPLITNFLSENIEYNSLIISYLVKASLNIKKSLQDFIEDIEHHSYNPRNPQSVKEHEERLKKFESLAFNIKPWICALERHTIKSLQPEFIIMNQSTLTESFFEFWMSNFKSPNLKSDFLRKITDSFRVTAENILAYVLNIFLLPTINSGSKNYDINTVVIDQQVMDNLVQTILNDPTSNFWYSFLKFSYSYFQREIEETFPKIIIQLNSYAKNSRLLPSAFIISFYSIFLEKIKDQNEITNVLMSVINVMESFPSISRSSPDNIEDYYLLERHLIYFFKEICKRYLFVDTDHAQMFVKEFSDRIPIFYIRFLNELEDNQIMLKSIEDIQFCCQFGKMNQAAILCIGSCDEIFQLISKSETLFIESNGEKQKRKRLVGFFRSIFHLAYSFPDSSRAIFLISLIQQRIQVNQYDILIFSMLSGAIQADTCRIDFFLPFLRILMGQWLKLISDREQTQKMLIEDPTWIIQLLKFFEHFSSCVDSKLEFMSKTAIEFHIFCCNLISITLEYLKNIPSLHPYQNKKPSLKLISSCVEIASQLLKWKSLNIGILNYYKQNNISNLIISLFDSILMIPLRLIYENDFFLTRFLDFLTALFSEYPSKFFKLEEVLQIHSLRIIAGILDFQNSTETNFLPSSKIQACNALIYLLTSIDKTKPEKRKKIHDSFNSILNSLLKNFLQVILNTDIITEEVLKAFAFIAISQVEERGNLMSKLFDRIPPAADWRPKFQNLVDALFEWMEEIQRESQNTNDLDVIINLHIQFFRLRIYDIKEIISISGISKAL